mmetsp:Transcript_39393/g.82851  ORF Transcript_39393/g.82851 Transcript_39393/m.82851 type:complete len:99 (+) Transcript_39393:849-1145(+)
MEQHQKKKRGFLISNLQMAIGFIGVIEDCRRCLNADLMCGCRGRNGISSPKGMTWFTCCTRAQLETGSWGMGTERSARSRIASEQRALETRAARFRLF